MTNEDKLKRIMKDPILWIEIFSKIVNKCGELVPFRLNPQQKELLNNMDKYNVVLKSRQLGISSLSCVYSLYIALTKPNSTCLLLSYSLESATTIFEKLKQIYNELPKIIQVPLVANNRKELKFTNGSRIICATCGNKDVARGSTLSFVHLSEIAFMKDTVSEQLLAIEQALTPNGKIILESTANGLNYFSELYNKAERGDNMYKPFFFSWVEDKIMFKEEYKSFSERYIELKGSLPTTDELDTVERELLIEGATIEQLVWRRLKIANSSEDSFNQEFPTTPTIAFITTGSNIFNCELLHSRILGIGDVKPLSKPMNFPTSCVAWINRGLTLWGLPLEKKRYYIGVDTGEGLSQDYSAIEVIDEDGMQVAEFKSNKIKPFQFAEIVNDISIYYNTAFLVIEKASAGHTVVDKLRNEYRYKNMYKYKEYDNRGNAKKKVGFITTAKTKPLMINDFVELWETKQICINSKDLLNEMKLFTFKDGKMMGANKSHDDLVMAFAMSIVGLKCAIQYI